MLPCLRARGRGRGEESRWGKEECAEGGRGRARRGPVSSALHESPDNSALTVLGVLDRCRVRRGAHFMRAEMMELLPAPSSPTRTTRTSRMVRECGLECTVEGLAESGARSERVVVRGEGQLGESAATLLALEPNSSVSPWFRDSRQSPLPTPTRTSRRPRRSNSQRTSRREASPSCPLQPHQSLGPLARH